jgi:hypothetical protein
MRVVLRAGLGDRDEGAVGRGSETELEALIEEELDPLQLGTERWAHLGLDLERFGLGSGGDVTDDNLQRVDRRVEVDRVFTEPSPTGRKGDRLQGAGVW